MLSLSLPLLMVSAVTALSFIIFLYMAITAIHSFNRRSKDFNIQLADKQEECDKLSRFTGSLQTKCAQLKQALEDSQTQYRNHLQRLKPEFNKLFQQLLNAQEQRQAIYTKYKECYESYASIKIDNSNLSGLLQTLEKEIFSLRDVKAQDTSQLQEKNCKERNNCEKDIESAGATETDNIYRLKSEQLNYENSELLSRINELELTVSEVSSLRTQLEKAAIEADAVNQLKEKVKSLKTERDLLSTQLDVSSRKVADLQEIRTTTALFESQQAEIDHLRCSLDIMRKKNADLISKGLYYENPPLIFTPASGNTIFETLSILLSKLHDSPAIKAATVADNLGLIVAETGSRDWTEGLAGIAALINSLDTHIHSFMPFGDFQQISITDINNVTVSAFPFRISDENLIILLLSAGEIPSWSTVSTTLSEVYNNKGKIMNAHNRPIDILQLEITR